ncbi:MAG: rhodanese-like domain-containing protein [Pseudomonadota bacterium]
MKVLTTIKLWGLGALLVGALSPAFALAVGLGPLVDPQTLNEALEQNTTQSAPLVLDIRTGNAPDSELSNYESGHIPGAVHAPYNTFRGPANNPGQLLTERALSDLLSSLGITAQQPVVVVHQGKNETDFGAAARVYWTLKSSGVRNLSILNGGVNAWQEAGLSLEQGAGPTITPSSYNVSFSSNWLATVDDIKTEINNQRGSLVDARPEAFWKGNAKHNAAARPGTIPTSRYFTHSRWFDNNAPAKLDADTAAALASDNGFRQGQPYISFCNTGHWAATNWFVLSEVVGLDDVKLYPESMVGYSHAGEQMANVPGTVRNLWNKVTGKY